MPRASYSLPAPLSLSVVNSLASRTQRQRKGCRIALLAPVRACMAILGGMREGWAAVPAGAAGDAYWQCRWIGYPPRVRGNVAGPGSRGTRRAELEAPSKSLVKSAAGEPCQQNAAAVKRLHVGRVVLCRAYYAAPGTRLQRQHENEGHEWSAEHERQESTSLFCEFGAGR